MKRREALQYVGTLMGGLLVTPALADIVSGKRELPLQASKALFLDDSVEAILTEIADTIIPTTPDSGGAKAAGCGKFINVLVSDCYDKAYQERLKKGILSIDRQTKAAFGKGFVAASPAERTAVLKIVESNAIADREAGVKEQAAWFMLKELTMFSYFTSEIGCTQALAYVYVPGKYEGCVPLKPGQKAWAT